MIKRVLILPEKNKIVIQEGYAEIILCNKNNKEIARSKIDLEDVGKIKGFRWYLSSDKYAITSTPYKRLHRLLLNPQRNENLDHINRDKLDNRKDNLRIATQSQNMRNTDAKGVDFMKPFKKWRARVMVHRKEIHLGIYNTMEEALMARKEGEIKYFGEYRNGGGLI